jgi:hypothetical protein
LPISGVYRGVRFEITKHGTGAAVLAQLGAKIVDAANCAAFVPLVPAPAPLGASCATNAGCASGICTFGGLCAGCTETSCGAGESCGVGAQTSPIRELPQQCVATGTIELGDRCSHDAECASGICVLPGDGTYGSCSTCRPNGSECGAGQTCGPGWADANELVLHAPDVCAPGGHVLPAGAGCATDDDCASSACLGTARKQCADGRECATAADCPFANLQNGPCTPVGVQGGSCQ